MARFGKTTVPPDSRNQARPVYVMTQKFCRKCDCETKRDKCGDCMPCSRARGLAWSAKNREQKKAANLAYYAEKKEQKLATSRAWKIANPDMVRAQEAARRRALSVDARIARKAATAEWKRKNPWSVSASDAQRRAAKRSADGTHSREDIKQILTLQKYKCAVCKVCIKDGHHVDHVIPLALGGSNWPSNLQALCQTCNLKKHAKHPVDFMQEQGFLL